MKNTISKSLLPTASILSIVAVSLLLQACSTARGLTTIDNRLQVANHLHRDSVYLHDSVFVRIRADTVWLEKWHTKWREKEIIHTDTIQVETTCTETVQVRYVPSFYKWCVAILSVILLYFLLRFAWWIYRSVY